METLEWTTVDKSGWADGPWLTEPDKRQWRDAATGLACLIHRGGSGALCGYVGIPAGHPAHGRPYDEVNVDVHGGLTFAARCAETDDPAFGICHVPSPDEPDDLWWLGFDCAHHLDHSPGYRTSFSIPEEVYRTLSYVEAEVARLAGQLADLGSSL